MSNLTFEELLRESIVDLHEQLEEDHDLWAELPLKGGGVVVHDTELAQRYAPMYVKYLQIFRKLEKVYDQVIQPQKRSDIRVLLDATIGRMLEVKKRLVRFCGDFINHDEVLVDLKLTPEALEIPVPRYFTEERRKELNARDKMLDAERKKDRGAPQPPAAPEEMTDIEAITILQCSERGRQGRLRAKFMREIREQETRERRAFADAGGKVENDSDDAARQIQKHFKGYLARKQVMQMRQQEMEFLGMWEAKELRDRLAEQKAKLADVLNKRKQTQGQRQQTLESERQLMREQIKEQEGGQIMEQLHDKLLTDIIKLKTKDDCRPDRDNDAKPKEPPRWTEFPSVEDGGSLDPSWPWMEVRVKPTPAEEQRMLDQGGPGGGKKGDGKKGGKKGKKDGGKGKKKGKGGDDDDTKVEEVPPSKFWPRLKEGTERYVTVWQNKFDATDFDQKHDGELLRAEIMQGPGGLEAELRASIDALIRIEIENLKLGLGLKGKKDKGKKSRGSKKNKKDKKGGKKKTEAPLPPVQTDIEDLVRKWSMPEIPKVRVADYVGAHNLLGKLEEEAGQMTNQQSSQIDNLTHSWEVLIAEWEKAETEKGDDKAKLFQKQIGMGLDEFKKLFKEWQAGNPGGDQGCLFEPSMAQVRQAVTEYCILPLGSQTIYDLVEEPASKEPEPTGKKKKNAGPLQGMTVLFYGSALSGKTMMSHAVATETGAAWFDLSPSGNGCVQWQWQENAKDPSKGKWTQLPNPHIGDPPVYKNVLEHVQRILRVAVAISPSIIYIDDCDFLFLKKKKKNKNAPADDGQRRGGPKAGSIGPMLKKALQAELRKLQPTDRVMVLGNCSITEALDVKSKPGQSQHQEMLQFFKTMIYFPHPDYASRTLLWKTLIPRVGKENKAFGEVALPMQSDYDILATLTNKCTGGTIAKAIRETLTERRCKRLDQRKLMPDEFLSALARYKPVFKDEYDRMRDFTVGIKAGAGATSSYVGIPLGRPGRRRLPRDLEADDEEDTKGKKGKKGKKKK